MRGAIATALIAVAGCTAGSDYGSSGATSSRTKITSGAAAGDTGGAAAASTGATSSGVGSGTGGSSGTSGGSTGSAGCLVYQSPLDACAPGAFEFAGSIVDALSGVRISNASSIQILDADDATITADVMNCGSMILCLDGGADLSLELSGTGYQPTLVETVAVQRSIYFAELPVFSSTVYGSVLGSLQDGSKPLVVVSIREPGNAGVCSKAGYVPTLTLVDGGALDAGDLQYLIGANIGPGSATASAGAALFLNLDPSLSRVQLQVLGPQDSGCVPVNSQVDMTGIGEVKPGYITILPYYVWSPSSPPFIDGGV